MSSEYHVELFPNPSKEISVEAQKALQASLRGLGAACFSRLPDYQVFSENLSEAFGDKILVTIRHQDKIIAFASAVLIPIPHLEEPVVHTGLTVIHPDHRKSAGVSQLLFGNLFLHLMADYPKGVWTTTLAEVISSLVHISKYASKVYPSPQWEQERGVPGPSSVHIDIAREISRSHRAKMNISPTATFDEKLFVFRGSNDHTGGQMFMKDVDDQKHWHRDLEASQFYRLVHTYGLMFLALASAGARMLSIQASGPRLRGHSVHLLMHLR
jgi:hypothetical protein